jgi:hypothetical protein
LKLFIRNEVARQHCVFITSFQAFSCGVVDVAEIKLGKVTSFLEKCLFGRGMNGCNG